MTVALSVCVRESTTKKCYKEVFQRNNVTTCYEVLRRVTKCYDVLRSVTTCYKLLQAVTSVLFTTSSVKKCEVV